MKPKIIILIWLLSASFSYLAAQAYQSDPTISFMDAPAILKVWEDNYANIKSMQVSYTERLLEAQPPARDPNRNVSLLEVMHVERVEQGNRFHIRYSTAEDGLSQPDSIIEGAFDGKITREYVALEKSGMLIRGMIGRNTETMNHLKIYMFLNRKRLEKENASGPFKIYWIEDPNSKPELSRTLGSAISKSIVSVLPKLEPVAGQLCHVVEITYKGNTSSRIWLAHEKGMLPLKYQRYRDNKPFLELEVTQIASVKTNRGKMWYPLKAHRTQDSRILGRLKYELTTHGFLPNVKVEGNAFRFDFPEGTRIVDMVRGVQGIVLPEEPPSLVDKDLPSLKDFNLKLDPQQSVDEMILVRFFDMNQRPSRNYIRQLAIYAEQFKQKGVSILV